MHARKVTIQFLDFRHQVVREQIRPDTCATELPLSSSRYFRIGVQHSKQHTGDSSVGQPGGAGDFGVISRSARFKGCIHSGTDQRLSCEFLFKRNIFGVTLRTLAAVGSRKHLAILDNDNSNLGMNSSIAFRNALPRFLNRELGESSIVR